MQAIPKDRREGGIVTTPRIAMTGAKLIYAAYCPISLAGNAIFQECVYTSQPLNDKFNLTAGGITYE